MRAPPSEWIVDGKDQKPLKSPAFGEGLRPVVNQAEQYRAQAERVLAEAQLARDTQAREALLEIASRYDWLAEWSARQHDRQR